MQSVTPVFGPEELQYEKVIALDQPEYSPLIIVPIDLHIPAGTLPGQTEPIVKANHGMSVRFRFSEAEREKITAGADLLITELVFGAKFTPLNFQIVMPDERPEV